MTLQRSHAVAWVNRDEANRAMSRSLVAVITGRGVASSKPTLPGWAPIQSGLLPIYPVAARARKEPRERED